MTVTDIDRPAVTVPAPAAVEYPYGLFAVAASGAPASSEWESFGARWFNSSAGDVVWTTPRCLDETVSSSEGNPRDWPMSPITWTTIEPFAVESGGDWPSLGLSAAERQSATRDLLAASEQRSVEKHLWQQMTGSPGSPQPIPADEIVKAVAAVEQTVLESYGGTPVLHMSRGVATLAISKGLVSVQSGRLITGLGSRVVAGAGYDSNMVIGTGALYYVRSEMTQYDETFDLRTNTYSTLIQRSYLLGWTGQVHRATV